MNTWVTVSIFILAKSILFGSCILDSYKYTYGFAMHAYTMSSWKGYQLVQQHLKYNSLKPPPSPPQKATQSSESSAEPSYQMSSRSQQKEVYHLKLGDDSYIQTMTTKRSLSFRQISKKQLHAHFHLQNSSQYSPVFQFTRKNPHAQFHNLSNSIKVTMSKSTIHAIYPFRPCKTLTRNNLDLHLELKFISTVLQN